MRTLLILILAGVAAAQAANRTVTLTWTASTSPETTGYSITRINGSTPTLLTPSPITALTFDDPNAVIGQTYTYQVVAVAPACTPTTPLTAACGQSAPATVATNIPLQPSATASFVVVVH